MRSGDPAKEQSALSILTGIVPTPHYNFITYRYRASLGGRLQTAQQCCGAGFEMRRTIAIFLAASMAAVSFGQGTGPLPYLQASDSPWSSIFSDPNFYLENFEDGLLNTPGVTGNGSVVGPGGLADSVDGDDGNVDGSGSLGRSYFRSSGSQGITFTFSEAVLGALPQRAGIVWTDGAGTITFEAFDKDGVSLGILTGNHADGGFSGTTAEDRFYGWESLGGIGSINIRNSSGGIEVDHLQYAAVPEPTTMALLGLGGLGLLLKRRAKKS